MSPNCIAAKKQPPHYVLRRLNIFYLTMEKLRGFAEKKYSLASSGAEIEQAYLDAKSDAGARIESLDITKRVVSTGSSFRLVSNVSQLTP